MKDNKPRAFRVHFNRINMQRGNPKVWTVHTSKGCVQTKEVCCWAPMMSVYKGTNARQPRAFMEGRGIIRVFPDRVIIL